MVIGNGTIANLFLEFNKDKNIIIFASGVSNSLETDESKFEREINLLNKTLFQMPENAKIVYFSSINIFDPSLQTNRYVLHKKAIEEIIKNHTTLYYIFRVPILISKSENPHTLINFLINKIKNDEELNIYKNAIRYFINSEDLQMIISLILKKNLLTFGSYNVFCTNAVSIIEVIKILENVLCKKAKYTLIEKGAYYTVNNDLKIIIEKYFPHLINIDSIHYIKNSIKKYYPDLHKTT